jgi:CMP-N,N'-diacetyllegionaminic acid synthase
MREIKILCLIPARSGSKGIPDKNIKILDGKPLMAHSIYQAEKSRFRDHMRIIVTTDSEKYATIAQAYGAECPFLRPSSISQDLSIDLEFMKHAVQWLSENENYNPDIILQLRPTQPRRKVEDIDNCLEKFIQNLEDYDSLRTVVEFDKSPYKMYRIINDNDLVPLFNSVDSIKNEPFNQCRQFLPKTYLHNGYIDILKTSLLETNKISGDRILPYVMEKSDTIDIDNDDDWKKAEINC